MTRHLPAALLAAALALPAAAPAAAPAREAPPAPAPPKPFQAPERARFTLENGLEVSLVPYGDVPKVQVQLAIDTGNVHEAAGQTWLADLTVRLLQEGTKTRSAEALAQAAAGMGGQLGIAVGSDQTQLTLEVLTESGPDAVALLADVAMNPTFPPSSVERLKGDLLRDMAIQRSQPQPLADERLLQALYGDAHPYGRYFPTEEMVKGYGPEGVRAFYEANLGAARSRLYVVGRYDAAAMEKAVREAFSGWRPGPARRAVPATQRRAKGVQLVDRPGAVQSTVRVAVKALDPSSPDWVKLQVMNTLLGGYFSSRITANIRERRGYAYSPGSAVTAHVKDAYWVQNADVTTAVTGASLKEILAEVAALRKASPPAEELKGVQSYMAGIFLLQNSSRGGITNLLRFVDLHGLSDAYLREYVQRVHAVTPEDVSRLARAHLRPDAMTIVVVGDRKLVEPQLGKALPAGLR